uniref:Scaffolding anchor of CK1 domain-containing protein n=1 Tax=Salarias fasciatus TaxID=181472 RepID=A0A672G851_SALFA
REARSVRSSRGGNSWPEDNGFYVQPHYKEAYRLAIYALLCGGKEAYEDFLRAEQINHFLSEQEISFMLENAELPVVEDESDGRRAADDGRPSTYFPIESDEEVPDLDLGWPEVNLDGADTSISLLFHPPRQNTPTIKEVVRKQIQEARQIAAIAMDIFTDVDIFKELISATLRGVVVYILLDESHIQGFLSMPGGFCRINQRPGNLRVRTVRGQQYQCRSGIKFHGGLEQKFILVDCQTVIYGTYSYTWSFEKINLSMVLVVTGQLVCSYDEEFRRLYARSTVPAALSGEWTSVPYLRDAVAVSQTVSAPVQYSWCPAPSSDGVSDRDPRREGGFEQSGQQFRPGSQRQESGECERRNLRSRGSIGEVGVAHRITESGSIQRKPRLHPQDGRQQRSCCFPRHKEITVQ